MYCKIYNIVKDMKAKHSKISNLRRKHNINEQKKIIENRKKFCVSKENILQAKLVLERIIKIDIC